MATANSTAPRNWLRLILDHNPFYLLSGFCMLWGCYLLSGALYTKAGDLHKLLFLLGVINAYEALIIPLGLVLIRRRMFKDDGRVLLALELLFLVDITFTNGVVSTINAAWGWMLAGALVALAALKVGIILRGLRLPNGRRIGVLALIQIAMLLILPAVYKQIAMSRNGFLPMSAVYLSWVALGALPLIAATVWKWPRRRNLLPVPGAEIVIGWIYLIVPFAALLVHLYSAAWVYSVPFLSLYTAPVLLGLACALPAFWPAMAAREARLEAIAIVCAIYVSLDVPRKLMLVITPGVIVSPLRLVLIASVLVSLWQIWRHHRWAFAGCGVVCLGAAVLGPTLPIMWENFSLASRALSGFCHQSVPRTNTQWGVAAVISAFVLLIAGAAMSLGRASKQDESEAAKAEAEEVIKL